MCVCVCVCVCVCAGNLFCGENLQYHPCLKPGVDCRSVIFKFPTEFTSIVTEGRSLLCLNKGQLIMVFDSQGERDVAQR